MEKKINVLLLFGGGGTEHEVSIKSADFFQELLTSFKNVNSFPLEIKKDGRRLNPQAQECELRRDGEIYNKETKELIKLHFAIPCIHGPPGENGQIQSIFELMGLPFLGCGSEASINCFNKVSTKLWLQAMNIPVVPFKFISRSNEYDLKELIQFFNESEKDIFIKASNQGSSVGCYHLKKHEEIENSLMKALGLSDFVLIEKTISGRELEVAAFSMEDKLIISNPGEIKCEGDFYDYKEKYSQDSNTKTYVKAEGLSVEIVTKIKHFAEKAFKGLNLKEMARIDFLLSNRNEIFINEINTFPGHTNISLFPLMVEGCGVKYGEYLLDKLKKAREI